MNLFPRRRRHFTSGLASRLFASNDNDDVNFNRQSDNLQEHGHNEPTSPPFRGGLRRDRLGNVVGHANNSTKDTVETKRNRSGSHRQQLPNSPHTISSRISARTDKTDPIDTSFASSSLSSKRIDDSLSDDHPIPGDNGWHQQTTTPPTSFTPHRPLSLRGGTGTGSGAPLAESMDQYEENAGPPFLVFPITSPNVLIEGKRHSSAKLVSPRNMIRRSHLEDQTESSLSSSTKRRSNSWAESSSGSYSPAHTPLRASSTAPSLPFQASPVESKIRRLQQSIKATQKQQSPGRRVAQWLSDNANKLVSEPGGSSGLSSSLDQGIEMLLNPVQHLVQCAAPFTPTDAEALAQPIPFERASSSVSGASTEVATNRAVDIAKRRIMDMEQQIERRRLETQKQQQLLKRQRELHEELDRFDAGDSLPADEEDAILQTKVQQTSLHGKFYRKGQEDEGDEPPDHQRPAVCHQPRLAFGRPIIAPRQLEQKSILSVSDDESSRMTHSTAQSNLQQHPLLESSSQQSGPPTTIIPKRRKLGKQVDLVPVQEPDSTTGEDTSSVLSIRHISSIETNEQRLQQIQENGAPQFPSVHSSQTSQGRADLMLPSLSPLYASAGLERRYGLRDRASLEHRHVTPPSKRESEIPLERHRLSFPTSPKSEGAINRDSVRAHALLLVRSPKSEFAVQRQRITQTRHVGGGKYLSPPRFSGRIPQVSQDSPDPVFCSKSIASTTGTPVSEHNTNSSEMNTVASSAVDRDNSFDSSILNQSKASHPVAELEAVKESDCDVSYDSGGLPDMAFISADSARIVAVHESNDFQSSYIFSSLPKDEDGDEPVQLSVRPEPDVGPSPETERNGVDLVVRGVGGSDMKTELPTLAVFPAISAYTRDQSINDRATSPPASKKVDKGDAFSPDHMKCAAGTVKGSMEKLARKWPPSATSASDPTTGALLEPNRKVELPETEEVDQGQTLYRSTPAWTVMEKLRTSSQQTLTNQPPKLDERHSDASSARPQADGYGLVSEHPAFSHPSRKHGGQNGTSALIRPEADAYRHKPEDMPSAHPSRKDALQNRTSASMVIRADAYSHKPEDMPSTHPSRKDALQNRSSVSMAMRADAYRYKTEGTRSTYPSRKTERQNGASPSILSRVDAYRHMSENTPSNHQSRKDPFHNAVPMFERKWPNANVKKPEPIPNAPPARKLSHLLPKNSANVLSDQDTEEFSIDVQSIRSAFESAASPSLNEVDNDDDAASVKSLRDKFEITTNNFDSDVMRMRQVFESKSRRVSKSFESGNEVLQEAFSKFQTKQRTKNRAKRYLGGSSRSKQQRVNASGRAIESTSQMATEDKTSRETILAAEATHISVAERAKTFGSLSHVRTREKTLTAKCEVGNGIEKKQSANYENVGSESPVGSAQNGSRGLSSAAGQWRKTGFPEYGIHHVRGTRRGVDPKQEETPKLDRTATTVGEKAQTISQTTPEPCVIAPDRCETQKQHEEPPNVEAQPERTPERATSRDRLTQAALAAKSSPHHSKINRFTSLRMMANPQTKKPPPNPTDRTSEKRESSSFANGKKPVQSGHSPSASHSLNPVSPRTTSGKSPRHLPSPQRRTVSGMQLGRGYIDGATGNYGTHSIAVQTQLNIGALASSAIPFPSKDPNPTVHAGSKDSENIKLALRRTLPGSDPAASPSVDKVVDTSISDPRTAVQKFLVHHGISNAQSLEDKKEDSASVVSASDSDFSDGVTLDVSIAEVSGLTLPTVLAEKSASTADARDEEGSSEMSSRLDTEARRSEASSSQTPEILTPLIAKAMQASDEVSAGDSFFASRALVAKKSWDSKRSERSQENGTLPAEEKKIDEGDSAGEFPGTLPAAPDMFQFDSEWRSFPPTKLFSSLSKDDSLGNRSRGSRLKTPTTSHRVGFVRDKSKVHQTRAQVEQSSENPQIRPIQHNSSAQRDWRHKPNVLKPVSGNNVSEVVVGRANETKHAPGRAAEENCFDERTGKRSQDNKTALLPIRVKAEPQPSQESKSGSSIPPSRLSRFYRHMPADSERSPPTQLDRETPSKPVQSPKSPYIAQTEETNQILTDPSLNGRLSRRYRNAKNDVYSQPETQVLLPRIPETGDLYENDTLGASALSSRPFEGGGEESKRRNTNKPKPKTVAIQGRDGQMSQAPGVPDGQGPGTGLVNSDNAAIVARLRALKESRIRRASALYCVSPDPEEHSCSTKSSTQFGGRHFMGSLKVD